MDRDTWIFWIVFSLAVISIILIVLLNLDFFNSVIEKYVGVYGSPAVFVLSFLSDSIDQPIGPEVVAGAGVAFGLNLLIVFSLAILGSFLVTNIHYYIGKHYLSKRIVQSCSIKKYGGYCKFFYKYGAIILLLGALTPVPYVFSIWLTSAFGTKYKMFLIFGPIARAFRVGIIALIVAGII